MRAYDDAALMYILMSCISSAYENRNPMTLGLTRSQASLLAELLRYEVTLATHRPRMYETALQLLTEQIRKNPEADWTIASMADAMHVSGRTLNRIFFTEYGITPIDLVVRERMARAYDTLAQTDMTIEEVSMTVGYESVTSFARLFKKHTGSHPINAGHCCTTPTTDPHLHRMSPSIHILMFSDVYRENGIAIYKKLQRYPVRNVYGYGMDIGEGAAQLMQAQRRVMRVQLEKFKCFKILVSQLWMLSQKLNRTACVTLREDYLILHYLTAAYDL